MAVAPDMKSVAARQLLAGVGIPVTPDAQRLVEGWIQAEGGLANSTNNPLNTTLKAPGAIGSMNSSGVQNYANLNQGVAADAKTLESPLYAGIRNALKSGNQDQFINALGSSPWGTGRDLISRVLGGTPAAAANPTQPQAAATQPAAAPTTPAAPAQTVDPTDLMQQAEMMQLLKGGASTKPLDLLLAGTGAQQTADTINAAQPAASTSPPASVTGQDLSAPAARALQGGMTAGGSKAPIASSDGGNPGAKVAKAQDMPLAKYTSVIGRPYQGTHTNFGNWESDNAVDLAAPANTPVYAVAPGRIGSQIGAISSNDPHLAGERLHLQTNGNEFYYQHLKSIVVKPGQEVKAGQLLGYTGAMNHLHFASMNGDPQQILGIGR